MINVIPQPKKAAVLGGRIVPGKIMRNDGFEVAAFDEYRRRAELAIGGAPVECRRDESLAPGAYTLRCGGEIALAASDDAGMNHALATLFQLAAADGGFEAVEIEDAPDYEYRGMMIDVARVFHPLDELMRYVDLCWLYKFSYLHIHFTDHESFTLPTELFPKLTSFTLSGEAPSEKKYYTRDELAGLCAYARSRGVKIMPELDLPGHCFPFTRTYPETFLGCDTDCIIGFTERSVCAAEDMYAELCEMFPDSDRVHIGGDESAIYKWVESPQCRDYAAKCGIPVDGDERLSAERMLATFIRKMSDVVLSHNKTPVCWEGFAKEVNYLVPRTTEIFSWENLYQLTPDLIAGGYRIINGSWVPNYIVFPGRFWSVEEMFDWTPMRFEAICGRSPYFENPQVFPKYDRMIGGQLLSWGDNGYHAEDKAAHLAGEFAAIAERAPATAEGTWNGEKTVTFGEFEATRLALAPIAMKLVGRG